MKIVVIRFSSLGDCVLLCPLFAHLKHAGASEVVVVTKRAYADLFSHAAGVDRVVAIESSTSLSDLARIGRGFRGDYVVIDAHANPRSRVVSGAAGGARARFRKFYFRRAGLIVFKRPAVLPTMLEQYASLAQRAGFAATTLAPGGIRVPRDQQEQAARRVGETPAVAVAPGSRWRAKRWASFPALCEDIAASGRRVVLVGDARDRAFTAPIAAALGNACIDAAGEPSLMQTAALIARCESFVGNDSGLMHLAEAVGVPVVSLFGPTVRAFGYAPSLANSVVVERQLACRPCSRNGAAPCPKRNYECLEKIGAEDVLATVLGPRRERVRVVD